jgi:hypothetical protein
MYLNQDTGFTDSGDVLHPFHGERVDQVLDRLYFQAEADIGPV